MTTLDLPGAAVTLVSRAVALYLPKAAALLAAAVLAGSLAACSGHADAPLHGVAFSQRVGEPTLNFPSTTGRPIELGSACAHRECVLVFLALTDTRAVVFVHRLAQASGMTDPRTVIVAATTDPAHDTLARLRQAFAGLQVVGVRGAYAMTEFAARSTLIDVEPPAAGPPPAGQPQAVLFRKDGTAAVGWSLSTSDKALADDLSQVAG